MRKNSFGSFVDKKKREAIHQLGLLKNVLDEGGFKTENFLHDSDSDPYIFCYSPMNAGDFRGVRIYKIGDQIAFRVQKESKTHPYGAAYPLPVQEMFDSYLSDNISRKKAGEKVIKAMCLEMRKFFEDSHKAERDERRHILDKDSAGNVLIRSTGTDYSSLIHSRN
jgi:hypothetical protein